ncbi:MAG TPA: hypothetical protein VFK07_03065 [Candidatus Paceibacterota bacterium]|nr:hypothetical protein [Candidatus Paceibacterota bacterium]
MDETKAQASTGVSHTIGMVNEERSGNAGIGQEPVKIAEGDDRAASKRLFDFDV